MQRKRDTADPSFDTEKVSFINDDENFSWFTEQRQFYRISLPPYLSAAAAYLLNSFPRTLRDC